MKKKLLANLMIAFGALVAIAGLIGTPSLQDLLPMSFMLPGGGQGSHQFLRIVSAESRGPDYLPYALLLSGAAVLIAGITLRRKLRATAA